MKESRENREERRNKGKKQIVIDVDKVFGFLCVGLSVTAVGVSLYSIVKLNGFSKKLGISIDELKNRTHIEITDDLVNKYTNKAVRSEAEKAAKKASDALLRDAYDILENQIGDMVTEHYDLVKDEVAKELKRKVNNISISALRAEVKDEAVDALVDKLENQMDDILAAQTDKLEIMAKAYKDMGEFMRSKA